MATDPLPYAPASRPGHPGVEPARRGVTRFCSCSRRVAIAPPGRGSFSGGIDRITYGRHLRVAIERITDTRVRVAN